VIRAAFVVVLFVSALLAACSSGGGSKQPPALEVITTTTTTAADYSRASLPSIAGATTMTISLTPGAAAISGTVVDDTGALVPGANVDVERIVGSATASTDTLSAADGTFSVKGILGGDYQLRAWRPPDLAVVTPQVIFLQGTQATTVTLQMQRFTGIQVQSSIAPNPPIITEPVSLAVEVTNAAVGPDGVVRGQGSPAVAVQLYGPGRWAIDGSPSSVTDGSGIARWQMTCGDLGAQQLFVLVNSTQSFPLNLPACVPIPTTTTTSTTTTTVARTTTTAHP
jgi:hypothetical protein